MDGGLWECGGDGEGLEVRAKVIVKVIGRPSLKGSAATPQEDAVGKHTLLGLLTLVPEAPVAVQSSLWSLFSKYCFQIHKLWSQKY